MKLSQSAKTAWLVMIMDFFHYIAFMCTKPYIKNLLNEANAPHEIAGFIIASFSLVQVLFALILGKWIQKKGQKPQLILGALTYFLGSLFLAFASEFGDLFGHIAEISLIAFSVFLFGFSHGVFLIAGHYVITGIPKEEGRDKYVGFLTFINSIGQFVAPVFAAALLSEVVADWISKFDAAGKLLGGNKYSMVLLLAAFASLVSLILACIIRNVTNGMTKKSAKVGAVFKNGPLMKIIFINAAVYFSVDVVSSYLQVFGEETLLLTASAATLVMSAVKFSAIFVRAFLGWLTRLIGSSRLLKISLLMISLTIIAMGATKEISLVISKLGFSLEITKVVVIMIIGLLYGLANGLVNPLALIELSNASDDTNRGSALALRNMCNSGGQTFGDVAFGYLIGAFSSLAPIFWVSGSVLLGCFFLSLDRKKK